MPVPRRGMPALKQGQPRGVAPTHTMIQYNSTRSVHAIEWNRRKKQIEIMSRQGFETGRIFNLNLGSLLLEGILCIKHL